MSTAATSATTSTVVNSVVINDSIDRVYRACTDIERWPDIFPTVLEISRTPVTGDQVIMDMDEIVMDMKVSNDLGENTVRSHRKYTPDQFRIDFTMVTLPSALAAMDGNWTVEPTPDGARLVVVHNFVPQPHAEMSESELSDVLYRTTENVLTLLKQSIETGSEVAGDGLRDAWGPRTAANGISPETFVNCELFFSRLGLASLDWGDITMVLKDLKKESTHEDWADWHRRWSGLGEHYEQRAAHAFAAGFHETGRFTIRRAAACHHFAEFFYFDDPAAKDASRVRVTEVFERGIPYLHEVVQPLSIQHDGLDLPGYLITPPGEGPWPCVVLVNGLDSAKEVELYAFAREFLARGMCAVVFDGPGQGLLTGRTPMVADFERVVGAVLEVARRQPAVDPVRIGIFGVSFGGYLAARSAATVPGIRACVNLSGGFDHDNYRQINTMVRTDFRFVFDAADDDAMEQICRESLHLRDTPRLQVPLLAIHGELDSIIPMESCERMLDWAAGEKELIRYPGERHVATNYFGDFIPRFCDWMAQRLGAVTR
ncbi:MAG: alpha/beta fold hydrolase [Pseudonocardiaceae bacterium]